jgi:ribose-phosphate pyrophosphokinase
LQHEIVIIALDEHLPIANKIADRLSAKILSVDLRIFNDGESKININNNIEDKYCIILHSTHPPVDQHFMQLFMMIHKCNQDGAANICAIIPYFGYARQDKSFIPGELVTIDLIGKILEYLKLNKLVTVDIHNPDSLKFKMNTINLSAIPYLANYALHKLNLDYPIVVSPDKGGEHRAKEFAKILGTETISLLKSRDKHTGNVSVSLQDSLTLSKKDIIIVDDMISTGNTIIKTSEILKSRDVNKIYVMCTHALLLDDTATKLQNAGITEIISTNSIPNNFSKVDLSELFINYITKDIDSVIAK